MKYKLLVLMLSLIMIITYTPAIVFAENDDQTNEDASVYEMLTTGEEKATQNAQPADSDALLLDYLNREVEEKTASSSSNSLTLLRGAKATRGSRLKGTDLLLYSHLRDLIEYVIDPDEGDNCSSTDFLLPLEEILGRDLAYPVEEIPVEDPENPGKIIMIETSKVPAEDFEQFYRDGSVAFSLTSITNALLADLPYALYWYDKTAGVGASLEPSTYFADDEYYYFAGSPALCFSFYVSADYSETGTSGTTSLSIEKRNRARAAAETAAEIINAASGSNYEILDYYREQICILTSYHQAAAYDDDTLYGDPWQMINVFDRDKRTDVVCEGYAKAFQFLCDNTDSLKTARIECVSVTGAMAGGTGAGPHMWNILSMDDGKYYLADITNCDEGSVGHPDLLFLKGFSGGGADSGYYYSCGDGDIISYVYDDDTKAQYAEDELTMSDKDYDAGSVPGHVHSLKATAAKYASCTEAGNSAYWTCSGCGRYFSDAEGKTEIAKDSWVIQAKGHTWDDGTVTKEATETENGIRTYTCTVCGETRIEIIPSFDHVHAEGDPVRENETAATCLEEGSYDEVVYCTGCGAELKREKKIIAKAAHTEVTIPAVEATCTKAGSTEGRICSSCGTVISAPEEVPAKGHAWGPASYEWNSDYTEVTGSHACSICKEKETETARTLSSEVIKAATLKEKGSSRFTSSGFTREGFEAQTITVETELSPEEREAEEEKARQGVTDKTIPKMTIKTKTSRKTSITIKWKWTSSGKKKLKKSKATKYEIWVCPNKKFAKEDTIVKICSKSKTSYTVKSLKKYKKYYFKIRAIKYVDGVKHVGPWSSRKFIKTKKK